MGGEVEEIKVGEVGTVMGNKGRVGQDLRGK